MSEHTIIVYGADWCKDCRRSKLFLEDMNIPYQWVDTDQDKVAEELVRKLNNGSRIIPTVVFEDGSFLAEPTNEALAAKLGIPA